MANDNRPGRDIFSEEIIQKQTQGPTGEEEVLMDFLQKIHHRPQINLEETRYELAQDPSPNLIIPTAQQMPPVYGGSGFGVWDSPEPWNPFETTATEGNVPILRAPTDKFGNLLPTRIPVGKGAQFNQEWEKEQEEVPWRKKLGFSGGGGIAGIQNLETGGNPNTDFTDVGFFGFEEQESVPSQAQQEEDRDLMQRAMDREEALANVARTDPYALEALSQSGMLAPEFPSGPLAPEPLLPVREQQRIHPFGLGDKAGIRFTDEETQRIYDYINHQREYDTWPRILYPEVELDPKFQLAQLKGTKPPKESVVTTFRGVPQDDKANVPIIKSTSPTTGGLSELDKLTLSTLDDDALSAETLIPTDINRGSFYDNPNYKKIEGERRKRQWENILKSQAERDALLAQQEDIESQADENYLNLIAQGPWSPASGPRYAPTTASVLSTDQDLEQMRATDETVRRAAVQEAARANVAKTDPYALEFQSGMLAPEPRPLIYTDAVVPQARDRAAEAAQAERAIIEAQADQDYFDQLSDGHILGRWREQTGKPTDERYFAQAPGSMEWTGRGGLSELDIGNLLKQGAIALGTAGVGNLFGLKRGVTPALSGLKHYLNKYFTDDIKGSELLVEEPWEGWETGGEDQMAQGGLISLAHGGNPSVYQAGENIEKLLATKMGYEGNKYSGVPNQQGMINTVNQGIGDNVKSGLRSIVANAYAQGNVPAPSVPQYNQAQLLNKGLTMLPNTANTPVPQQPQPQQPPAQGNISNVYAQSTLPQSHYMQPNQVI